MKLLTLTDRLAGMGMTGAVCAVVMPTLLALGTGYGSVATTSSALKTFDIALPQSRPMPEPPVSRPSPPEPGGPAPAVADRPAPPAPGPGPAPAARPEPPAAMLPAPAPTVAIAQVSAVPLPAAPVPARAASPAPIGDYAGRLWAHIAARRPAGIRLEGTTIVAFTLSRNGQVTELAVAEASGNAMLDRLALRSVRQASPLPPPPDALRDDQLRFTIPFSFR
jgi:protein TonB